jgi:hypothetical protein
VPSSPDRPRLARAVPDFQRISGDASRHKALARRAYKAAREAEPIPSAIVDRLWLNTLRAVELAPPTAQAKMWRRHETLCVLLLDQHRWPRS